MYDLVHLLPDKIHQEVVFATMLERFTERQLSNAKSFPFKPTVGDGEAETKVLIQEILGMPKGSKLTKNRQVYLTSFMSLLPTFEQCTQVLDAMQGQFQLKKDMVSAPPPIIYSGILKPPPKVELEKAAPVLVVMDSRTNIKLALAVCGMKPPEAEMFKQFVVSKLDGFIVVNRDILHNKIPWTSGANFGLAGRLTTL
jgi:hypothetical protein